MMVGLQMYGGSILIDVVCLKVGLGYKAEYVNQLFEQVKKTTNVNNFICITDKLCPLRNSSQLRIAVNKLNDIEFLFLCE